MANGVTRRSFIKGGLAAGALATLAACGKKTSSSSASDSDSGAGTTGGTLKY